MEPRNRFHVIVPSAYVAWRAGTIILFLYSVPSRHRLFKNSSTVYYPNPQCTMNERYKRKNPYYGPYIFAVLKILSLPYISKNKVSMNYYPIS